MTPNDFNKYQLELIDKVLKITESKGKEYANSAVDRFANFNRLAAQLDMSNIKVCMVYLTKHFDAISNYVKTEEILSEPIEGRIVDAITYLILLAGMIKENSYSSEHNPAG